MAKYRITSLPGNNKRIPLSKAQFGGLNKFLEGGDPCPPEKQIYPQFSQFGCISNLQYNKLIEQSKANLEKQKVFKETRLADQKALRNSYDDPELFEKLKAEWKTKYPEDKFACRLNDSCPEYDLVLEPDPVIPPIVIPPKIEKISLSGYPDVPIYNPTDTDMIMPTIGIGPGETKSRKNRGILMNGKGQNYKHTTYRQTKDLDFGTREATRPIPKMIQKYTGYDRKFMEGYEDEEGNYIPGEIEKAEEEGRQINFKGIASLRDKKEQQKYNQEWEQHNIEKAGIREYNLNLLKEAGISPEEYVKEYGEFQYGGLHKFVAGGPSACPEGQYWNGTKCVPVQGFNPLGLLTNAANAREAQAKAIEAARVAKEKARVAKLSEEDKNYEHFLGAPPKKAKPKVEPIPGSMQLKGDPYAITYEGELEKALAALTPEERRALEEAELAKEAKLLDEKSKRYSQYLEDNKYDQPLSNAFASDNTKVFNPLGPSSLEKNRNKYFETEREQEDFIMNEVYPFSKKKESFYQNVEKSKGDPKGDRYSEALAAENAYTGEIPSYNAGEMFNYDQYQRNKHVEGYDPKTKLYYTSRGVYNPATGMYKPNPIPYQGTGAVKDFRPENYFIGGMGARAALIPLGEKIAASAAVQAIKTGFKTALPLGEAITSATASTLTPANLMALGFGLHGATTVQPNLNKFIADPNLNTGVDLGFSGLEILGSPGVGNMLMKGAKPIIDLGKAGVNKVGNFLNAKAAREAEMYEFGSKLNKFNRENYTGPQYYSEQPIQDPLLLESGSVTPGPGPTLLPIGTTNEVRSTAGNSIGSTPLLNEGTIGFNPTVSLDDIYNNISGGNRATLSRFLPEQNITREPTLFDTETDLFLNQRPLMDYNQYETVLNNAQASPPTSLQYEEYQAAVNEAERLNIANAADTRSQAEAIEAFEIAKAEQQAAKANYFQNPSSQDAIMRRELANRELAVAEENVSIAAPNYRSQPPVNNAASTSSTASSSTSSKEEAIDAYETARAEQQAATAHNLANPYTGDVNSYELNYRRWTNANEALRLAEENLALQAPDYISQPYIPSSANLNTTTGAGTANINNPAATAASSFNMNLLSETEAQPKAFDRLAQALGTSPTKNINYSSATIDALTHSRPNNYFHNGQTIETQLSNITDPVDYVNRLRELAETSITRPMYDELAEGLSAHLNNAPNPSIRNDAALDIINAGPDALYTGSNLSEIAAQNLVDSIPSYELDDAIGYYGYNLADIERFFADANLSDDVRRVAYNQIKDDYRYMADFNIFNPNARPVDFAAGQITSPALKKTNNISDYKTLKISQKSKDILDKTMYKDLDLSTGSVSYLNTESKYIDNIRDKANLVSNKDLNKQLEAYEEAYAIVKEKGGFAERLIRNKLEDLKGTKYLRTTYADQMRAEGKDPSEIMECSIISHDNGAKSLLDKDGVVLGTVNFYKATWLGEEYSQVSSTGVKLKYHSHSLKHSAVKTWDKAEKVLTKKYLDDLLNTVDEANRKNPVVVKHFTRQAEVKAADQIKQLQINNNNKFGEALYAGTNAALKDTRGGLATKEGFSETNLPDQVTGVRIIRPRAENAWRSWGKNYYKGVPRVGYYQGPSMYPIDYQTKTKNFLSSPNFILRKLGGDVSKLSRFTQ